MTTPDGTNPATGARVLLASLEQAHADRLRAARAAREARDRLSDRASPYAEALHDLWIAHTEAAALYARHIDAARAKATAAPQEK